MTPRQKKRFYVIFALALVVLFSAGIITGYVGRKDTICKDGKAPVQQKDTGLGQVAYLCHNGQIVTNS